MNQKKCSHLLKNKLNLLVFRLSINIQIIKNLWRGEYHLLCDNLMVHCYLHKLSKKSKYPLYIDMIHDLLNNNQAQWRQYHPIFYS